RVAPQPISWKLSTWLPLAPASRVGQPNPRPPRYQGWYRPARRVAVQDLEIAFRCCRTRHRRDAWGMRFIKIFDEISGLQHPAFRGAESRLLLLLRPSIRNACLVQPSERLCSLAFVRSRKVPVARPRQPDA